MTGIAIGGFMGVGKSTVGLRLAERLGLPFVDTDTALVDRHGPIAVQIRSEGERVFRDRERELIAELCDGQARVLATGGGAWADALNRRLLRACYFTVVLSAPLPELRRRVGDGEGRPLWRDAERLLATRADAYADADLLLETAGRDPEHVVEEILCRLP